MFRKFNIKTLAIVFVVLLGMLLVTKLLDSQKGERTFKSDLVNIDSAASATIGNILLYPQAENHAEIKFTYNGSNRWEVQRGSIKAEADTNSVKELLRNITQLKSQQLTSNDKNTWKEYSVNDSLGTRIKILSKDNDVMADIVIGRFSYNQMARSGSTYVRLYGENEVYSVEGFLAMSVNQKFEQWRVRTIVSSKYENWNKVSFQYPADSGFVITKQNKKWMIDTVKCDSAKTAQYLNRLANLSSTGFVDAFNNNGKKAAYILKIEGDNQPSPITVQAYEADAVNKYVINSSMNPETYYSGTRENLFENLFTSKSKLLPPDTLSNQKQIKKKK